MGADKQKKKKNRKINSQQFPFGIKQDFFFRVKLKWCLSGVFFCCCLLSLLKHTLNSFPQEFTLEPSSKVTAEILCALPEESKCSCSVVETEEQRCAGVELHKPWAGTWALSRLLVQGLCPSCKCSWLQVLEWPGLIPARGQSLPQGKQVLRLPGEKTN